MPFEIPLVSYICVSNRWSFIYPMLSMFHAQSWPHKELVLIDSSPGGKGIDVALSFGEWMQRSPLTEESAPDFVTRFEYRQVNEGALVAMERNLGMELAKGEYMTWLDDDGWHDPRRVEQMMTLLDKHQLDAVGIQGLYWIEPTKSMDMRHYIGTDGMPISGSMVFHRRCADQHRFDKKHRRASDHFWINLVRRDKGLKHGTVNRPELCVGVSHGLNISNPGIPTIAKPCGRRADEFHGNEPYGLNAHARRIVEAVKELKA